MWPLQVHSKTIKPFGSVHHSNHSAQYSFLKIHQPYLKVVITFTTTKLFHSMYQYFEAQWVWISYSGLRAVVARSSLHTFRWIPVTTRQVTCLSWLTSPGLVQLSSSSLSHSLDYRWTYVKKIGLVTCILLTSCFCSFWISASRDSCLMASPLLFAQFSYKLTQLFIRLYAGQPLFVSTCVLYLILMKELNYRPFLLTKCAYM